MRTATHASPARRWVSVYARREAFLYTLAITCAETEWKTLEAPSIG